MNFECRAILQGQLRRARPGAKNAGYKIAPNSHARLDRLVRHQGKQLDEYDHDKTLADYGLSKGSTLYAVARLSGGMPRDESGERRLPHVPLEKRGDHSSSDRYDHTDASHIASLSLRCHCAPRSHCTAKRMCLIQRGCRAQPALENLFALPYLT